MAKQKSSNIITAISYAVFIMALVGVIGFLGIFSNWFTDDFKSFYVSYNGKVLPSQGTLALSSKSENRFEVGYTFNFLNGEESRQTGYTVKLLANPAHDFDFSVNDQLYSFAAETDLASAFDLKTYDNYFTLDISETPTMQAVLKRIYASGEIATVKERCSIRPE